MFTRIIAGQFKNTAFELYKAQSRGLLGSTGKVPVPQTWQEALDRVRTLYEGKDYEGALKMIAQIEEEYPQCTKATKFYRGKVSMALLEEDGTLEKLKIK